MSMTKKSKTARTLMLMGCLLLCAAAALTAYNVVSEARADTRAEKTVETLKTVIPARTDTETTAKQMQTITVDGNTYIGYISIPALNIDLPVNSEWSYPLLKKAPCRYKGSVFTDDLIIAGHNYQRHFGGLKLLQTGDEVDFTDADGIVYKYTVSSVEKLTGKDVQGMEDGDWDLTLFTCTIGGAYRVTVRCQRADNS
jgi:sortase A